MNFNNQFVVKPWGDADRSIMVTIMNSSLKFRSPENHIEHKRDVIDITFGDNLDFTRDVLRFENEEGEIVGYAGVTNSSGRRKTWSIATNVLPEYFGSSLPKLLVKECISLAERSTHSKVFWRVRGEENVFEQHLQSFGYKPFHYLWGMRIVDIDTKTVPVAEVPKGITIQQVSELADYSQYASVENAAFRGTFEYQERSSEELKKWIDFQRNYFEIKMFLAYDEINLVGLGLIVVDTKNNIGYGRSLAVHPDHQNRGIGGAIISNVLNYLQNEGMQEYKFHVDGENERAMDIYKSFGFQELKKTTIKFFQLK